MITRNIGTKIAKTSKSILLLGPRQVGKSTLVNSLNPELTINLADELEFLKYSSQPGALKEELLLTGAKEISIDEIQRIPSLLNTIQSLIDSNKKLKFFLTGSSARKLKRGQVNLLPGRVLNYHLGPFSSCELNYKMDSKKALEKGCLPEVYLGKNSPEVIRTLRSYVANYIKEEIRAESLVRNLDSFARFLNETISSAGQFVDYSKMSKKSRISRHAIPRYFEILEDTLIGDRVFSFDEIPADIKLVKHPKFYFFDNGVYNGLLNNFTASQDRIGVLFEQLVFSQLKHSAWAQEKELKISSFRDYSGNEVDFVLDLENTKIGLEVKTSDKIISDDLEGLHFLQKTAPKIKDLQLWHLGATEKKLGSIWVLPWQKGLKTMGL